MSYKGGHIGIEPEQERDVKKLCGRSALLPAASVLMLGGIVLLLGASFGHAATGSESKAAAVSGGTAPRPGIPIPANSWTTFQTDGFPAEIVGYDATVYAKAIKRHIVLGKYHHYSSEPNYCMDAWSYDENRWDILDCGAYFHTEHMMEGGHPVGAFVYMPSRASIVYWGGQSGSNQPEQAFHTWWWDVAGNAGRDKLSTTRPGNIKVSAMAYDESRDKIVFYPDAAFKVEIYDPATNQWSTPVTSGTPPPHGLTFPTLDWDTKDQKTFVYGGAAGNNCNSGTLSFNSDVYTYDPGKAVWSKLEVRPDPVNGLPSGRWYAGFAYDADDNVFLLAGGQNCSSSNRGATQVGLTDTWRLDMNTTPPQWTKLKPVADFVLKSPGDAPFQKLRYDPDHHAFVMILPSFDRNASRGGSWGNYLARVWVYCYTGTCPNVGTANGDYAAPEVSLNRNARPVTGSNQTWSSDTAIAADEGTIYAGWVETSEPFSNGACVFHHPYVQSARNGIWSRLGLDCTAMDSNAVQRERDAEKMSLAVVKGTPWASWAASNNAAAVPNTVFAKYWNGAQWVGGAIGTRNPSAKAAQGFSQLLAVGAMPTIAFIENNKNVFPDLTEAYVDQYDGASWRPMGTKLNVRPNSRVESVSIASDGTRPWACWTEEVLSGWTSVAPSELFCARWEGTEWKRMGPSLNMSEKDWAAEATTTYAGGQPYVAWTERSTPGNANLFVKTWNGAAWVMAGGGPLNKDTRTGWTLHPRLTTDGANVYLSWEEQASLGQHPQLYVAKWNAKVWSALGEALNMDVTRGSVSHSSTTMLGDSPVVLWNEVQIGQLQQTYAKRWDGSRWILIGPQSATNK